MSRRKRFLNELDQDIREHIELETQDNIGRGMSPEEARYAALRKFGNVTRVKEETREVWSLVWLEQVLQDIRVGLRMMRKSPGFSAVAILTLALGVGANTAIFSVINGVLLSPFPYKDPKQLVVIKENVSLPNVMDMTAIDRRLAEQYPAEEKERKTILVPLQEWLVGDVRPALLVLFGAVTLVLLIACANFASLLMMRAVAERQELVIRAALGAGRGRLIRKTLTESALLSVLGGAAGLVLAKWGTSMLLSLRPENLARLSGIHMDTRVLLFVLVVSLLTGIVLGMAPVRIAARVGRLRLDAAASGRETH